MNWYRARSKHKDNYKLKKKTILKDRERTLSVSHSWNVMETKATVWWALNAVNIFYTSSQTHTHTHQKERNIKIIIKKRPRNVLSISWKRRRFFNKNVFVSIWYAFWEWVRTWLNENKPQTDFTGVDSLDDLIHTFNQRVQLIIEIFNLKMTAWIYDLTSISQQKLRSSLNDYAICWRNGF